MGLLLCPRQESPCKVTLGAKSSVHINSHFRDPDTCDYIREYTRETPESCELSLEPEAIPAGPCLPALHFLGSHGHTLCESTGVEDRPELSDAVVLGRQGDERREPAGRENRGGEEEG